MKNLKLLILLFLIFLIAASECLSNQAVDPVKIMTKVDDRYDGDDRSSDMIMILINKKGKKRKRELSVFTKDIGEDTYSASFFLSPQDVKDTGFLSYDYDKTTDDDQWLYLPALHKVKRIASDDKTSSFMGSDFSYADMTDKEVDDYNHKFIKDVDVNGKSCHIIESTPKTKKILDDFGYKKSISFVDKETMVVIRAVHWLKEANRVKFYDVKKLEIIDGIATPVEIHMTLKKGGALAHKTILYYKNIKYNQGLDKSVFTTRQLEKGIK